MHDYGCSRTEAYIQYSRSLYRWLADVRCYRTTDQQTDCWSSSSLPTRRRIICFIAACLGSCSKCACAILPHGRPTNRLIVSFLSAHSWRLRKAHRHAILPHDRSATSNRFAACLVVHSWRLRGLQTCNFTA